MAQGDRFYEPRTQVPGVGQPALAHAPQTPVVQIGQAYSDLERGINSVGKIFEERQAEEARAWSSNVLASTRLEWSQHLTDRMSNAQPNAPEFTKTFVDDFNKYAEDALSKAPSPAARTYLTQRLNAVLVEYAEKAKTFEAQARIDYRTDQFTNAVDNSSKLMNSDPDQYQSVLAERLAEIDSSSMPPVKKSALRQKAIDNISKAAVWSQIQRAPGAFLDSIGFSGAPDPVTGKTRQSSGDLQGRTGNTAFDMLPFETRTQMFEQAVRLKAQTDADLAKGQAQARKDLADAATKGLWAKHFDGTLKRIDIDRAAPLLPVDEYRSLLKALTHEDAPQRSDPGVYRDIQVAMNEGRFDDAQKMAYKAHRAGQLSNEHLTSFSERARNEGRQEGPKSAYERSRSYLINALDPGPFVQDPLGKQRYAEAIDEYEKWFMAGQGKRTDEEIDKFVKESVGRYKIANLGDTLMGLPAPRSGSISRNASDTPRILNEIAAAANEAQRRKDTRQYTEQEYINEMTIINRWRKAVMGTRK